MLNRSALIVHYKQPFVDWINAVDPGTDNQVSLSEVNRESNVYLVEVENQDELEEWLDLNFETLFEEELYGWYTDPTLWPQDRSLELFQNWCSLDLYTMVYDTGSSPIEDDEEDDD